jgi:hypothetical protein
MPREHLAAPPWPFLRDRLRSQPTAVSRRGSLQPFSSWSELLAVCRRVWLTAESRVEISLPWLPPSTPKKHATVTLLISSTPFKLDFVQLSRVADGFSQAIKQGTRYFHHVDVLPCSAFGSPCGGKKIVQHHAYLMDTETIRLLPPTHLLNRKVQTANEIAEQLTDLQQPISDDLMKAIKDVLALVEIKKTMESRAGQAGLPFVTPVEPPSPNTQRLSEGIDLMALHSSSMTQSSPPRATAGGGQGRSMFSQSATTSASSQPSSLMSLFGKL